MGGHAEPDNCESLTAENVGNELFYAQREELCEELNITADEIIHYKLHSVFGVPPSKRRVFPIT